MGPNDRRAAAVRAAWARKSPQEREATRAAMRAAWTPERRAAQAERCKGLSAAHADKLSAAQNRRWAAMSPRERHEAKRAMAVAAFRRLYGRDPVWAESWTGPRAGRLDKQRGPGA